MMIEVWKEREVGWERRVGGMRMWGKNIVGEKVDIT